MHREMTDNRAYSGRPYSLEVGLEIVNGEACVIGVPDTEE